MVLFVCVWGRLRVSETFSTHFPLWFLDEFL